DGGRVGAQQPGVAADEPAQRHTAGQLVPLLVFQRLDLARGELDAAGHFVERPTLGQAKRLQGLAHRGSLGLRLDGGLACENSRISLLRHACTCAMGMVRPALRRATRVRSRTSPANWPQAASMSSPRVLRTVVTMPASISLCANTRTRAAGDRFRPEAGNGLKGIRLSLQCTCRATWISALACSSVSLMPSSMQYSKVMKSR